jgi:hypothetical protein
MRCVACDKNLSNYESTRKIIHEDKSVYYPDLCNNCFSTTDISEFATIIERHDLASDSTDEELDIPEE